MRSSLVVLAAVLLAACSPNDASISGADDVEGAVGSAVGASFNVHLRTAERGLFLVAEGGGGGEVRANRVQAGAWETFKVIPADGKGLVDGARVFFQTASGEHYLMAEEGGGRGLHAASKNDGPWEELTLQKLNGGGEISHGDRVALRTHDGHYVVAESGGGAEVNANRTGAGPWETFELLTRSPGPTDVSPSDVTLTLAPIDGPILGTITGYEMDSPCPFADESKCENPIYKTYNRNDPEWWDALVDELLHSRVHVVMAHGRGCIDPNSGDSGNGNMCPRVLRHLVAAIDRADARGAIRLGMFDDTGAYQGARNIVEGRPWSERFDMADPSSRRFFWDHNMKIWFDQIPKDLWFRHNGRPVVAFWTLSSYFFQNQKGNASALLRELRAKFKERYGEDPLFIVDTTWIDEDPTITANDAWGANAWFGPPQNNFTYTTWGGKSWGALVPSYRDPDTYPGCGAGCREVTRNNGDTLRRAFDKGQSSQFILLEGWTNVVESAGFYRSDAWSFPNQYVEIVREYSDRATETLRLQVEAADAAVDHSGGNKGGEFRRGGDLDIGKLPGGWFVGWTEAGESLTFKQVKLACGTYRLSARTRSGGESAVRVNVGGEAASTVLPAGDFRPYRIGEVKVPAGHHDVTLTIEWGSPDIDWLFLKKLDGC